MIRCLKADFTTSKEDFDRLFDCNRLSAEIWNKCLDVAKQYRKANNGKWIANKDLQKHLKGSFSLHSQSIQAVGERYCDARAATKEARAKGYKDNKYPWRHKKNYPTRWKQGIEYDGCTISLPMGGRGKKRRKPIVVKITKSVHEFLQDKTIKVIDLIWSGRLMLAICFDDKSPTEKSHGTVCAGIDLGEIHSVCAANEEGQAVIITGRKLRAIHRFRNMKLAEISRKQSKCSKGSRRWKKLQRAKRYMLSKNDAQVRDTTHKITKSFVDWA